MSVPDEFKLFGSDVMFSSDKANSVLGFSSKIDVDEGLHKTVKWLEVQGVV